VLSPTVGQSGDVFLLLYISGMKPDLVPRPCPSPAHCSQCRLMLWTYADHIASAPQVEAVFLAAAVKPAAGSPVRRQYGPSAPADAVAGPTLPATLPQPAQLALPAGPLSALLPSPFVPQPMPSRALELARLHQAWQQKHFKRMPLSQYLNGRWAGPVWVPQRDVPASGRDAVLPAAPVQTGPAAAAAPASEHVQQPARRTSAAAVSSAAAEEEPDADGEPAPRSAHGDRHERQRVAKQARLLAKLEKGQKAEAQRLKRRQKLLRRAAKRAAAAQRQRLSAEQRADDGTAASADDDATDADDASKLPRAVLLGQPLEPLRCPLAQQPVAGSAAAELAQHEQPVSLPTYDPWQDVDSPHPAPLLPCTSASVEPAAAEQGAPLAAVAAPAAAVTDAAEQESSLESGEVGACCAWNEAPLACGSDLALRLTPEPGQNAQPRTGDQAPLLLKPKKGNLNKAQRYKRRLERLARLAAQREAAQQKRQAAQQRADHGAAASADDGAMHTDDLLDTPGTPLPGQPSESSRAPLLGQQPAAGSAAAEPAQAEQPVSPPIYDPWQDVDHPHPAPPLAHTSASAEPEAAAQEAPAAYDPWEAAESSQGLQLPTTTEQWSPIVHRDAEHVDPPAQGVGLPAAPPHTGAAATGLRSASTAAPHLVPAGERSQQQPERPSAAEAGYDPWEEQGGDAAQLTAKASSANEQPVQPAEKQPSAAVADYDPWVDVEA